MNEDEELKFKEFVKEILDDVINEEDKREIRKMYLEQLEEEGRLGIL
jgi:predicted Ser/Thr protein kinase